MLVDFFSVLFTFPTFFLTFATWPTTFSSAYIINNLTFLLSLFLCQRENSLIIDLGNLVKSRIFGFFSFLRPQDTSAKVAVWGNPLFRKLSPRNKHTAYAQRITFENKWQINNFLISLQFHPTPILFTQDWKGKIVLCKAVNSNHVRRKTSKKWKKMDWVYKSSRANGRKGWLRKKKSG